MCVRDVMWRDAQGTRCHLVAEPSSSPCWMSIWGQSSPFQSISGWSSGWSVCHRWQERGPSGEKAGRSLKKKKIYIWSDGWNVAQTRYLELCHELLQVNDELLHPGIISFVIIKLLLWGTKAVTATCFMTSDLFLVTVLMLLPPLCCVRWTGSC